jgi:hypothetical protein
MLNQKLAFIKEHLAASSRGKYPLVVRLQKCHILLTKIIFPTFRLPGKVC